MEKEIVKIQGTPEPQEGQEFADPLTGLNSRNVFFALVEREIEKAKRNQTCFALLIINIVGFRRINLTVGNDCGDLVLNETAKRIRDTLRQCDIVARLGGDEFAALLPSMISEDHATLAVHKILHTFEEPIETGGKALKIQLNIGMALHPDNSQDAEQLLRHATMALLHAEHRNKAFSVYRNEEQDSDLASYAYSFELRSAVEQNSLLLHYQPKWDIKKCEVTAAEALVRWPHPDYGLIGPNRFIPIAEESDLIRPLTLWVINEAIRQCAGWHKSGLKIGVCVNLSTKLLQDTDLPVSVMQALDIWSINAEHLTLEVTETAILEYQEQSMHILHRLASMGVSISIDDFGAGYSSFAYLCNLPARELKIDRTIVNSAEGARDNKTVLRTIIELGHNLGFAVTAEGVEDEKSYGLLEKLECDMIQGYFISPPVAANRFSSLVQKWGPRQTRTD